jgi:L-aminopeptidase/D-esterase-like protein
MASGTLTDVAGLRVGHATDPVGLTGCTVILCEGGAVAGVDVRGSAAGTRELAALDPEHIAPVAHAIVLAGGSAFGLDAASGVMRYLDECGVGLPTPAARVPIVAAAILYDLGLGDPRARPDAEMGYAAALRATAAPVEEGSVGAGTGATVGKVFGMANATKGGLGSASVRLANDVVVGALVVVNAFGDVVDPASGAVIAGARRRPRGSRFVGTASHLVPPPGAGARRVPAEFAAGFLEGGGHTTLAVVATNATLDKPAARRLATRAHDGLARVLSPAHMTVDGDTVFALALGSRRANLDCVATAGVRAVEEATVRAILAAAPAGGVPCARDLRSRAR